ncbi:hypothetical protein ACP2AV_08840 [Aliiroseovarius sp. PTFE2010]|uniref:hypothetical protein n=1 Tax=Aliiroseovarius sp. PTFE2010 TaxID=3417190 RepID=UPI003CF4AA94
MAQDQITLSAVRLPQGGRLTRSMPLPAAKRTQRYVDAFDHHTLIYDCFADADGLVLICPRLLNLWPVLRDGLRVNGVRPRIRRQKFLRYEELRVPGNAAAQVSIELDDTALHVSVNPSEAARYAGRRALVTQFKDTPLDWIVDWARYHASAHGVDAILAFDNGSTLHDTADVQAGLQSIPGVAVSHVVRDPFPYGDAAGGRFVAPAKYLQTAMLNLARLRFFPEAAGVLSLDVDEMLAPVGEGTVFDIAARAPLGLVSFTGAWLFAAPDGPQPQRAHDLHVPGRVCTNPKWCAVPGKRAARLSWAVHRPAGPFAPLTRNKALHYWHCHSTSTSWKKTRSGAPDGARPCPAAQTAFARHLTDG